MIISKLAVFTPLFLFFSHGALADTQTEVPTKSQTEKFEASEVLPSSGLSTKKIFAESDNPDSRSENKWHDWHAQLQLSLRDKFVQIFGKLKGALSNKLVARASFRVSRDGKVTQVKIVESSFNAQFDSIAIESIKALEGNPALKFPEGTTKKFVDIAIPFRSTVTGRSPGLRWSPAMWE